MAWQAGGWPSADVIAQAYTVLWLRHGACGECRSQIKELVLHARMHSALRYACMSHGRISMQLQWALAVA